MFRSLLLVPLAMIFQGGSHSSADAEQGPGTQHVRVEITTSDNGKTSSVVKEFDAPSGANIQDSLRAWGIAVPDDAGGAYLGVSTENLNDNDAGKKGVRVVNVVDGTPADEAGLMEGDVIAEVDNKVVDGASAFSEMIRGHKADDEVNLTILRDGNTMSMKATLAERPAESYAFNLAPEAMGGNWGLDSLNGQWSMAGGSYAFLGVTPKDGDNDAKGAVIASVEAGSAADSMGIKSGDVITRIGKSDIADFDALSSTVRSMEPGDEITVKLQRNGKAMTVKGRLGKRSDTMAFAISGNTPSGAPQVRSYRWEGSSTDMGSLQEQLNRLQDELDELRNQLGHTSDAPGTSRREVRITVQTIPLSPAEKDLLKDNGVSNLDKEMKLDHVELFPNPSSGPVHLRFGVPARGDLAVDIHNATGKRVYHETVSDFVGDYDRTLDLSDKAPGSYFVVITQNGRTMTQKLIKQ